jgi:hypothetical protein
MGQFDTPSRCSSSGYHQAHYGSGVPQTNGYTIPSPIPPAVATPMFTGEHTLHDFCQFVAVAPESEWQLLIPNDPNTGARAAYVTFTAMEGEYTVSTTGHTDFSHVGLNCPLLNPDGLSLLNISDLRIYSKHGVSLKVCWYRQQPTNQRIDRAGRGYQPPNATAVNPTQPSPNQPVNYTDMTI